MHECVRRGKERISDGQHYKNETKYKWNKETTHEEREKGK